MEALVLKGIRRMRGEVPKKNKELQAKLDEAIALLAASVPLPAAAPATDADKYFPYYQAACESGDAKVMELALDGVHALIEHGYLRGRAAGAPSSLPLKVGEAEAEAAAKTTGADLTAGSIGSSPSQSVAPNQASRTLMDNIIEVVCKCSDEFNDGVQLQVIKVLLTAVTSAQCEVNESSLLLAVRACFHIHLISKNSINKVTTKAALTQMVNAVNAKMEAIDARVRANSSHESLMMPTEETKDASTSSGANQVTSSTTFASIQHKDSFLLFRALCKLSMKGLHDDSREILQADAVAMQNKILSLELILHILLKSGPAFKSGDRFVYVIRNYLCVSLLGNCTSHVGQVTDLSLQIFVTLMDGFKDHLKSELEVFFTNVFLRILDSENSTFEHKLSVLEVFHSICRDPRTLAEIFINYDCDLDAIDLFKRIVDGFARVTKNPNLALTRQGLDNFIQPALFRNTQVEEHSLRKAGLEGFVTILRSLMRSRGLLDESAGAEGQSTHSMAGSELNFPEEEGGGAGADSFDGVTGSSGDISTAVTTFDKKQRVQEEITTGILKFNLSSKKGLAYLANANHIQMAPKSVAAFFHQHEDRLDKAVIGDFLGREKEYENGFCIETLHEYVEMLDFASMEFDLAIRHFLQGFRLPGEAQKIDRIMEKFAERYYLQNQDKFASADMAFILAFSTIMLQTNLHNPAIREDKRMTKEEFIKQNTKISEDGELSVDMLMDIYDRIAAQPISMTQDDKLSRKLKKDDQNSSFGGVFQVSNDNKRRLDAFNDERKEMVRAGEAMFKKKSKSNKIFLRQSSPSLDDAYLSPMFEVTWAPLLGVLSQILETYDDPSLVSLCLTAFEYALRLSCRVDNTICRSTYVNGLIKFTALGSVREMRHKNVECIKVLVNIALTEGDFLEEDWVQVLQSVSQLARLQLFAMGSHPDDVFFGNVQGSGSKVVDSVDSITKYFSGPSKAETVRLVEEANAEMILRDMDSLVVDQIFLNSQQLSDDGVQHFVRALCAVSFQEITSNMNGLRGKNVLDDTTTPRIFSLQKLVEVADFNMSSRSRIAWTNMWDLLAQHFTAIGIHENHHLAMYAIDSLKQLSIKFLQKEELSNFNFQRIFLRPFEFIMMKSRSPEIKDLILRCIDNMILACATNIRSGWRTIFSILEASATQDNMEISRLAFLILERLMMNEFGHLIFDFVDLTNCLVKFIAGIHTASSLKALSHLSKCAAHLADGGGVSAKLPTVESSNREDDGVFRVWWPLLLGLSTRVSDSRLPVRLQALETLHGILRRYAHLFSSQAWAVIFRGVLFPIMDSAKTDATLQPASHFPTEHGTTSSLRFDSNSWIGTMSSNVLSICLDLFFVYRDTHDGETVLSDLLMMLEDCICQDTESLAVIGVQAYKELILSFARLRTTVAGEGTLEQLCSSLSRCFSRNLCFDFGPLGVLATSKSMRSEAIQSGSLELFSAKSHFQDGRVEQTDDDVGTPTKPRLSAEEEWKRRASSLMTTMVVTLRLMDVLSELFEAQAEALKPEHCSVLLNALQASYWHARSFNEDQQLRRELAGKSFMTLLPHLNEQEAVSATKIVRIAMSLYLKANSASFIEPWITRYCSIVCTRYIDADESGRASSTSSSSSSTTSDDTMAAEYRAAVLVILQGLRSCTLSQFQAVISQSISQLILSSDYEIRASISSLLAQHRIF